MTRARNASLLLAVLLLSGCTSQHRTGPTSASRHASRTARADEPTATATATPRGVQTPCQRLDERRRKGTLGRGRTMEVHDGTATGTDRNDLVLLTGDHATVDTGRGADLVCNETTGGATITTGNSMDAVFNLSGGRARIDTGQGRDYVESSGGQIVASLGTARDLLVLSMPRSGDAGSRITMGTGRDRVALRAGDAALSVDLHTHLLEWNGVTGTLRHDEEVNTEGSDVVLRGDGDDDRFVARGCRAVMLGGGGDDHLIQLAAVPSSTFPSPACTATDARLAGGAGDDVLQSNAGGNDVLLGGPGRDLADGGDGTDRCLAEIRHHCES